MTTVATPTDPRRDDAAALGFLDAVAILAPQWRRLLAIPTAIALVALAIAFIVPPKFTARTLFLPPAGQGSGASSLLSGSLGSLAALVGAGSLKPTAEQYIALMQSTTVSDHMIDRFKLMEVYDRRYRMQAREDLERNVHMQTNKKDGLIAVEVDDTSPQRAADMANQYVEELRQITKGLALTEAQQRRVFFESQLKQTRDNLTRAQIALQESGFNPEAIKSEPKTAAEGYAKLRAELTAAEIKLQALGRTFADAAPEVQQQATVVAGLRAQLKRLEQSADLNGGPDYVTKFREFKYQEALFELFARQYEQARVDESRDAGLIQVVDVAAAPERKSKPQRALITALAWLAGLLGTAAWLLTRHVWRQRRAALDSGSPG